MKPDVLDRERTLAERFGPLMSLEDVVQVLKYPSMQAARKAIMRGSFPLEMIRLPSRRGLFVTARQVALYIDTLDRESGCRTKRQGPVGLFLDPGEP